MRLSEAIREGAKLSGQAFGYMTRGGNACALGAAVEWVQFCQNATIPTGVATLFPIILNCVEKPCRCEHVYCNDWGRSFHGGQLGPIIAHLNDFHMWRREAIAEWVETIETKLEASSMAASERKTEETTSDTSAPVSTREIESVHSSV